MIHTHTHIDRAKGLVEFKGSSSQSSSVVDSPCVEIEIRGEFSFLHIILFGRWRDVS